MYNDLNSEQMVEIAKEFSAMNGYIPDCTNVGTTFVNSIANMLSTAAYDVSLDVASLGKLKNEIHVGQYKYDRVNNSIKIGTVRYG